MADGTTFWPTPDHWSVKIPLHTPHRRLPVLDESGFVALSPMPIDVPREEWESLEYMDWKSGGDTNFAPLASADGELDCRGFWDKGKTDKDALWTVNAEKAPTLRRYVDSVGANFGRCPHHQARAAGSRHGAPLHPPRRQQSLQPRRRRMGRSLVGRTHRSARQLHAPHGQRRRRTSRSVD